MATEPKQSGWILNDREKEDFDQAVRRVFTQMGLSSRGSAGSANGRNVASRWVSLLDPLVAHNGTGPPYFANTARAVTVRENIATGDLTLDGEIISVNNLLPWCLLQENMIVEVTTIKRRWTVTDAPRGPFFGILLDRLNPAQSYSSPPSTALCEWLTINPQNILEPSGYRFYLNNRFVSTEVEADTLIQFGWVGFEWGITGADCEPPDGGST